MIGVSRAGKTQLSRRIANLVAKSILDKDRPEILKGFNLNSVVRDGATENRDGELAPFQIDGRRYFLPPFLVVTDDVNGLNDEHSNNKMNLAAFHSANATSSVPRYHGMEKKSCTAKPYIEIKTMNVVAPRLLTFMNELAVDNRAHHVLLFPRDYNFKRDGYVYKCKDEDYSALARALAGNIDEHVNTTITYYCQTLPKMSMVQFIEIISQNLIQNYDQALEEDRYKLRGISEMSGLSFPELYNYARA